MVGDDPADPVHQRFRRDGFGQVDVAPGAKRKFGVRGHGVGADHDDRGSAATVQGLDRADRPRRLEPVKVGHLHIHQDQVKGVLLKKVDGLHAVMGLHHLKAVRLEDQLDGPPIDGVILRQQNLERRGRRGRLRRGRRVVAAGVLRHALKRQDQLKLRPDAERSRPCDAPPP